MNNGTLFKLENVILDCKFGALFLTHLPEIYWYQTIKSQYINNHNPYHWFIGSFDFFAIFLRKKH